MDDREGNLWFSTIESGVYFAPSPEILHYTEEDGLPGNRIFCLEKDFQNRLWIGTIKNKYAILDHNEITSYSLNGLEKLEVASIRHFNPEETWVVGKGLTQRILNGQIEHVARPGSDIWKDDYGNYWFGQWSIIRLSAELTEELILPDNIDPTNRKALEKYFQKSIFQKNAISKTRANAFEQDNDKKDLGGCFFRLVLV